MKLKSLKIIIIIFILLVIAGAVYFILNNTESKQSESKEISYKTVSMVTNLRLGISDFDSIHPYISNNREILNIDQLIFEPLLCITEDYKIKCCLAKEWTKLENKAYLIKLKENVLWQNKSEFTAEDVKFSIENLKNQTSSVYYENVKNIEKVEVIDKYTVRIELNKEIPFFEYNLIFPIICSKQYETASINSTSIIPLGTGKYKIKKIDDDKIEIIKNENWRDIDNENCNFKTISINLYDTMGKVYNAFKVGSIDFVHTNNNEVEEYIGSMGYDKKIYANREYDYLALNCESSILQFKEVRQAINMIIDKDKIVASVLENKATVAKYPLANNYYLLTNIENSNKVNIEKAKDILKNAGWEYQYGIWQKEIDGITKTINIDLAVNKSDSMRVKVAEEIQKELENAGIKVNVNKISESQYKNYLKNHEYEMLLTGIYTAFSPDLTNFLAQNNLANYNNEEIVYNLKELNNVEDENSLKEKYNRIFEIYNDDVPYIGLYYNHDMVAYSTSFMGDVSPNCYSIFYNFCNWYMQ